MYNRVILMGRLVADPELRQTQSGISMCRLRIAVDRGYAKQGEERQSDFFNVVCWRQQAEFVSRYFSKGRMIHVEGRLQNSDYTDQNGVKHYSMDIVADSVTFCGDKRSEGGNTAYIAPNQFQQQFQQAAPQQARPAAPAPAPQAAVNRAPQPIELGDLGDFEEILSDGEVPF